MNRGTPRGGECGENCSYRQLYDGAQSSLMSMTGKHQANLERVQKLRSGVIRTLKSNHPRLFAQLESEIGEQMRHSDDRILLIALEQIFERTRVPETSLTDLRAALESHGFALPGDDDPDVWAALIASQAPTPKTTVDPDPPALSIPVTEVPSDPSFPGMDNDARVWESSHAPDLTGMDEVETFLPPRTPAIPQLAPQQAPASAPEPPVVIPAPVAAFPAGPAVTSPALAADPLEDLSDLFHHLPAAPDATQDSADMFTDIFEPEPEPEPELDPDLADAGAPGAPSHPGADFLDDLFAVDAKPVDPVAALETPVSLLDDLFTPAEEPLPPLEDVFVGETGDPLADLFADVPVLEPAGEPEPEPEPDPTDTGLPPVPVPVPSRESPLGEVSFDTASPHPPAGDASSPSISELFFGDPLPPVSDPSTPTVPTLDPVAPPAMAAAPVSNPSPPTAAAPDPAPAAPAPAAPAPAAPAPASAATMLRPTLSPHTPAPATPARRKRNPTVSATRAQSTPSPTVTMSTTERRELDTLLSLPKPLFLSDVAAIVGTERADDWLTSVKADRSSGYRFLNPKSRWKDGALIIPTDTTRSPLQRADTSGWRDILDTYRGTHLYAAAHLFRSLSDNLISTDIQSSAFALTVRQPSGGVYGLVGAVGDDYSADSALTHQVGSLLQSLAKGRLDHILVVTTSGQAKVLNALTAFLIDYCVSRQIAVPVAAAYSHQVTDPNADAKEVWNPAHA